MSYRYTLYIEYVPSHFVFLENICVYVCMDMEAKRRYLVPWNWNYRPL